MASQTIQDLFFELGCVDGKTVSTDSQSTVFILLGIGIIFIGLLFYTFEILLAFGLGYMISIPVSFITALKTCCVESIHLASMILYA